MSLPVDMFERRVQRLERTLRMHQYALFGMALSVVVLAAVAFREPIGAHVEELTLERLTVVEPDGQPVMALANSKRLPPPLLNGKPLQTDRRGPGLLFFDGHGWEVGGLVYGTEANRVAYGHLSFDQFHNDQVVLLSYEDDGRSASAGLRVVDRARSPTLDELLKMKDDASRARPEERERLTAAIRDSAAERIFLGSRNETAMLRLRDRSGRDRIRLSVDRDGMSRLEFIDSTGRIVQRLPE